jgi:hypothetical protein
MAVASVAHPEENSLSSPNAANLRYAEQERNISVSFWYKYVLGCH